MSGESTPVAGSENGDSVSPAESRAGTALVPGLRSQFEKFSKFGDTKSDGRHITLSQSDKWMKQSTVIDGKNITTTDTAIAFKKHKKQKIHFKEFEKFLDELASSKKLDTVKMMEKLANCGSPAGQKSAQTCGVGGGGSVYDRLCDPKRYGASHRHRFDETGKGRGLAGRRDMDEGSGYVHGYKNRDTYPTKQ